VDGAESARRAIDAGAGRLELCDLSIDGGVTPNPGVIEVVRRICTIPLHVLIRPRGGDFRYTAPELTVMLQDIAAMKRLGVNGVAVGALTQARRIARRNTRLLIDAARPMAVTFHRAFDATPDPRAALETLIGLGVERVLTSGGAPDAESGIPVLRELVRWAGNRIVVMAGGGIRNHNVGRIIQETGVVEVHAREIIHLPIASSQ